MKYMTRKGADAKRQPSPITLPETPWNPDGHQARDETAPTRGLMSHGDAPMPCGAARVSMVKRMLEEVM